MFFNLNIASNDLYIYLIVLSLSAIILFLIIVLIFFIFSFFWKHKFTPRSNKLLERIPKITILEKYSNETNEMQILINNYRDARYYTNEFDNDVTWENKKYRINQLDNIEIFLDNYGLLQNHAILIFNFIDEYNICKKLCVSYEIRHEASDLTYHYKAILGNYQGLYILGSFEDLVGIRFLRYARFDLDKLPNLEPKSLLNLTSSSTIKTSVFKNVMFYKLNFTKQECQQIFLNLMHDVNLYAQKPHFYNFIYRNCLSEILKHFSIIQKEPRFKFHYLELFFIRNLLKDISIVEKS